MDNQAIKTFQKWSSGILAVLTCMQMTISAQVENTRSEGVVVSWYYQTTGDLYEVSTNKYVVDANGAGVGYKIKIYKENNSADYHEVGSDDIERSYFLDNLSQQIRETGKESDNVATGTVRASYVPQYVFASYAEALWIHYVASGYYKTSKSQDTKFEDYPAASYNIFYGKNATPDKYYQVNCILKYGHLGELESLVYLHPNHLFDEKRTPLPGNYKDGYVMGDYKRDKASGGDGVYKTYTLRINYNKYSESKIVNIARYEIKEEKSTSKKIVSYLPEIPGPTYVSEERYNTDSKKPDMHFTYMITNAWQSEDSLKSSDEYKKARYFTNSTLQERKPGVLLYIFIAGAVSVLVVWIIKINKN